MGEWMVLRSYRIHYFEKGVLVTRETRKCLCVFEVFEKTRGISKPPHSYFLCVGVPRRVTKLFRVAGENMRCREIQIGRNISGKIRYSYGNHSILMQK